MARAPTLEQISLPWTGGTTLEVHAFRRPGRGPSVVYLHGLGSSLRDFLSAADPAGLPGCDLLAFDFPGCGRSVRPPGRRLTLQDLAGLVLALVERECKEPPVLVGHSMGGLVGLLAARRAPGRIAAFVNVEGNLAPDDCFLSRKGADWPARGFAHRLKDWLRARGASGFLTYAERFEDEVEVDVFRHYSRCIVRHSDRDPLLAWFLELECPRCFLHGEEAGPFGYLPELLEGGVSVTSVPHAHHFPLYSNPVGFYAALRAFLAR